MAGWIKLHRKIRINPIFNDHQLLRLWLICLTEATHQEREQIIGNQTIALAPGQFITGRFDLLEMYNQGLKPRDKIKGEKTVYRWLEKLMNDQYLTIKKTNKYSVVTIVNWDIYQTNEQILTTEPTNKRPTNDHQMTTNKNVKNVKNNTNTTIGADEENYSTQKVKILQDRLFTLTGQLPSGIMLERLLAFDDMETEVICEAISEAEKYNKRNLGYVETVLRDWNNNNIKTLTALNIRREEWEKRKRQHSGKERQPQKPKPKPLGYVEPGTDAEEKKRRLLESMFS